MNPDCILREHERIERLIALTDPALLDQLVVLVWLSTEEWLQDVTSGIKPGYERHVALQFAPGLDDEVVRDLYNNIANETTPLV